MIEPPKEHVTSEEAREIKPLKDEAARGETLPWEQIETKVWKLLE